MPGKITLLRMMPAIKRSNLLETASGVFVIFGIDKMLSTIMKGEHESQTHRQRGSRPGEVRNLGDSPAPRRGAMPESSGRTPGKACP